MKERIEQLRKDIIKYNEYYYNKSESLISDEEYDKLLKELKDLEEQYPEYNNPESPTQKIIVIPSSSFEKTQHLKPMLSLDNVYSIDELKNWFKNFDNDVEFLVEMKMDGASVNLLYENNKLTIGSSRGNGCVDSNTLLKTKNGYKKICNIDLNDEIATYNFNDNKIEYVKPINIYNNDNKDKWYEIKLENNQTLKLTENHQIWCINKHKYIKVKDIEINDEVDFFK